MNNDDETFESLGYTPFYSLLRRYKEKYGKDYNSEEFERELREPMSDERVDIIAETKVSFLKELFKGKDSIFLGIVVGTIHTMLEDCGHDNVLKILKAMQYKLLVVFDEKLKPMDDEPK